MLLRASGPFSDGPGGTRSCAAARLKLRSMDMRTSTRTQGAVCTRKESTLLKLSPFDLPLAGRMPTRCFMHKRQL